MEDLHGVPESPVVSSNGQGEAEQSEAERELAEAWGYVHELTKALTGVVGGGSEMFVYRRGRYIADIPYCVERLRDRAQRDHRMIVTETLRATDAEAVLAKIAEGTVPPEQNGHYLAHRECVRLAREAVRPWARPTSPIARLSRELGASNASTGTPTNTSTHTGDQPL